MFEKFNLKNYYKLCDVALFIIFTNQFASGKTVINNGITTD